jgi:hypothetical protein
VAEAFDWSSFATPSKHRLPWSSDPRARRALVEHACPRCDADAGLSCRMTAPSLTVGHSEGALTVGDVRKSPHIARLYLVELPVSATSDETSVPTQRDGGTAVVTARCPACRCSDDLRPAAGVLVCGDCSRR